MNLDTRAEVWAKKWGLKGFTGTKLSNIYRNEGMNRKAVITTVPTSIKVNEKRE